MEESLDDDEVEPEPEPEDEGDWCDTLGTIPYPLEGNLTVSVMIVVGSGTVVVDASGVRFVL